MSSTDKAKLDGIANGASDYSLPIATSSVLGGVKLGSNITSTNGTISVTKENVTDALGYTPPTTNTTYSAAGTSLGLVKSGGDVSITNGVITVNDDSHNHIISNIDGLQTALDSKATSSHSHAYGDLSGQPTIPTKTSQLTNDSGFKTTDTNTTYTLTKSGSTIQLKDNTGTVVSSVTDSDNNTTYSAAGSDLGLVKSGGDVTIADGVISVNDDSHNHTIANIDSLQTTLDGKISKTGGDISGDLTVSKVLQCGRLFNNVVSFSANATVDEIVIKTKIPYKDGNAMPLIHLKGYAYGVAAPIEITVAFYIYDGVFVSMGATSTCPWKPTIKLSTYTESSTKYVALSLIGSIYYPRFIVDMVDIWHLPHDYSDGWSATSKSSTSSTSIVPSTNITTVHYKDIANNISGNAATATKATQDASGNVITSTYAKKSELPTKTSQLTNDSGFKTTDTNTTYTLAKSGSTIQLKDNTGTVVSSVTDSDTNTTYTLSSFGITATAAELNYVDGVTSNIQTQINNIKTSLSGIETWISNY